MKSRCCLALLALLAALAAAAPPARRQTKSPPRPLNVRPPHISTDKSVKYDYDIVYVRAPRRGDNRQIAWTEVFSPLRAEPGSDLMLLHPDGKEEILVAAGDDTLTDPFVSFDGQWVYYAHIRNVKGPSGGRPIAQRADIFKIHVKSRKTRQLTHQDFTPNAGVVAPSLPTPLPRGERGERHPSPPTPLPRGERGERLLPSPLGGEGLGVRGRRPGVYNLGPCPLPGGKVMFTSNRNGFEPTKGYTPTTLQLFVMDDDGSNVEQIGYLNINSALHPTILKDGRVMFTSYESQGLRDLRLWALWTIHPDGSHWQPLASNFANGASAFHFMSQLSDGHVVFEEYYNLNNLGFGTYYKVPPRAPEGRPSFGPASPKNARNLPYNGSSYGRIPFTPYGLEWLTPFVTAFDAPAPLSDRGNPSSMRVGKVTHPSGAPDNHLLTTWSPGPVNSNNGLRKPAIDSGIYLLKSGRGIDEPGKMLLIKNDPNYNEQWPRALVPYKRIYGVDEPARLPLLANDGKRSPHLPEGTPFGLVGSSSLYKRESYPWGGVPRGKVTATYEGGNDPFRGLGTLAYSGNVSNWFVQGADTCRYDNSEIHAIRILVTEPTTSPRHTGKSSRLWWNVANERLRILGEIPVRKFGKPLPPTPSPKRRGGASSSGSPPRIDAGASGRGAGGEGSSQPLDPDGNPDTSFLAKIPADVAWTFQTLDKDGMALNMAQTWHQLRPGEIRNDCGGCHAHSQKPTDFKLTAAAKPDYVPFDLTRRTPLLTSKARDESGRKWDTSGETGLRFEKGIKNVEYFRDVRPIFERSCVACHTKKSDKPAAGLALDDDTPMRGPGSLGGVTVGPPRPVPGTFLRLALDHTGRFGRKSPVGNWSHPQASRYVRAFQARRSLLIWKIYGKRLDGFSNDDFATEAVPGNPQSLRFHGKPFANKRDTWRLVNLAYSGSVMPPPEAVKAGKVKPLTDEDRRTLARWIDLGCPIDLDFDPRDPAKRGSGWMQDDSRPTLTLTFPRAGANDELTRILVGMHDCDSGLDRGSFRVVADFAVDGTAAGKDLAPQFKPRSPGVWEMRLRRPIRQLRHGVLTVSVKDRQGNVSRIERVFSIRGGKR